MKKTDTRYPALTSSALSVTYRHVHSERKTFVNIPGAS